MIILGWCGSVKCFGMWWVWVFRSAVTDNFGRNGSDTSGDEKRLRRAAFSAEDDAAHVTEEARVMRQRFLKGLGFGATALSLRLRVNSILRD